VRTPSEERRLIIGCRDPEFGAKLLNGQDPAPKSTKRPAPSISARFSSDYGIGLRSTPSAAPKSGPGGHGMENTIFEVTFSGFITFRPADQTAGASMRWTIHSMSRRSNRDPKEFGNRRPRRARRPTRTAKNFVESGSRQSPTKWLGSVACWRIVLALEYPATAEKVARRGLAIERARTLLEVEFVAQDMNKGSENRAATSKDCVNPLP